MPLALLQQTTLTQIGIQSRNEYNRVTEANLCWRRPTNRRQKALLALQLALASICSKELSKIIRTQPAQSIYKYGSKRFFAC